MSKCVRSGVLLAVLAPLLGCDAAPPAERRVQTISVREQWTSRGSEDVALLGWISSAVETQAGTIWVVDGMTAEIIEFTSTGQAQRVVARKGDGPGELRTPTFMTRTPSGFVAVLDIGRVGIDVFEPTGSFDRRVQLGFRPTNPKGFAAGPGDVFYISSGVMRSPHALHAIENHGAETRSWYPIPTPTVNPEGAQPRHDALQVAGGSIRTRPDGHLVFSQSTPHRIVRFPPGDTVGVPVAADPDLLAPIVDDFSVDTVIDGRPITMLRWFFPQSRGVFLRSDGTLLNVITLQDEDQTIWQAYTEQGDLIGQSTIDRAYWPWDLTTAGRVLASYRDPDTDESVLTLLEVALGPLSDIEARSP